MFLTIHCMSVFKKKNCQTKGQSYKSHTFLLRGFNFSAQSNAKLLMSYIASPQWHCMKHQISIIHRLQQKTH